MKYFAAGVYYYDILFNKDRTNDWRPSKMSKIRTEHIFTSESVSEGHPDKVSDQISDAILDACLEQDPESRVACETLCTTDLVVLSGEITTNAKVDWEGIARNVIREIGYNSDDLGFCADSCDVKVYIHKQSPDISQGVTVGEGLHKEQGAGDQGMMFGYACNETESYMPATIHYAHRIVEELARLRKSDPVKYSFLRPDSKSQVSMLYKNGKPVCVKAVVVSHQHTPDMEREQLETLVKDVVKKVIPAQFLNCGIEWHINPTGRFVLGGPAGDTGLTGRKIIVDTYGGVGSHGGGAFSGKDPSKVDICPECTCKPQVFFPKLLKRPFLFYPFVDILYVPNAAYCSVQSPIPSVENRCIT